MENFESLFQALDGWFEAEFEALPLPLGTWVRQAFFPCAWAQLAPDQRRSVAAQWDQQHDPARERERHLAWRLAGEMADLEREIERWTSIPAPTALDLAKKEEELVKMRQFHQRLRAQMLQGKGYAATRFSQLGGGPIENTGQLRYLAYPRALARLRDRLNATPSELAAWIFMGPNAGGLEAYVNANELDPPPRFHFATVEHAGPGTASDYLAPMMACWFRKVEVEVFEPGERYMVGADLVARWSLIPDIDSAAFVRAKIRESRLLDLHPLYGGTQGTFPEDLDAPPLESGLFRVSEIEAIEAEDFDGAVPTAVDSETTEERRQRLARRIEDLRGAGVKAFLKTVAQEEGLSRSRIKQLLQGQNSNALRPSSNSWLAPIQRRDRAVSKKQKT